MPNATAQVDDLLLPLLQAEADDARHLIESLVVEHAGPVIKQIIRSKLYFFFDKGQQQDAEDIHGEVQVLLLARLHAFRSHPADNAIGNFRGYVAVCAYNVCHEYIRRKAPRYHQLKNRLRYLMTHHPGFALWESESAITLCGFVKWQEADYAEPKSARLAQVSEDPQSFTETALAGRRPDSLALVDLTSALFNWLGHPVEFDQLVNLVARLCGVAEQIVITESDADSLELLDQLPDLRSNVESEVEARICLEHLWAEVIQLNIEQRTALLLNLRDEKGGSVIELLPITGIASIRRIAEILAIPPVEFIHLWPRLPLDDDTIAARLVITRQQVINLRLAARRRLFRRLKFFREGASAVQSERRV
jgi:DNA-directed RNA polymerase specialized sigma24 family protein